MSPSNHLFLSPVPSTMSNDQAPPAADAEPASPARDGKLTLAAIFHLEESALVRFATGLTGSRATAEEIVQDGFMKLHQHWHEVENPRAWLYRCVRNLALNHRRDHARETTTDTTDTTASDPSPLPDELLGQLEACGTLRMLIAELPGPDRDLVELKYRQHLPYAEISRRTGLGVGNVGYRLHHILKSLADSLRRAGIESPLG